MLLGNFTPKQRFAPILNALLVLLICALGFVLNYLRLLRSLSDDDQWSLWKSTLWRWGEIPFRDFIIVGDPLEMLLSFVAQCLLGPFAQSEYLLAAATLASANLLFVIAAWISGLRGWRCVAFACVIFLASARVDIHSAAKYLVLSLACLTLADLTKNGTRRLSVGFAAVVLTLTFFYRHDYLAVVAPAVVLAIWMSHSPHRLSAIATVVGSVASACLGFVLLLFFVTGSVGGVIDYGVDYVTIALAKNGHSPARISAELFGRALRAVPRATSAVVALPSILSRQQEVTFSSNNSLDVTSFLHAMEDLCRGRDCTERMRLNFAGNLVKPENINDLFDPRFVQDLKGLKRPVPGLFPEFPHRKVDFAGVRKLWQQHFGDTQLQVDLNLPSLRTQPPDYLRRFEKLNAVFTVSAKIPASLEGRLYSGEWFDRLTVDDQARDPRMRRWKSNDAFLELRKPEAVTRIYSLKSSLGVFDLSLLYLWTLFLPIALLFFLFIRRRYSGVEYQKLLPFLVLWLCADVFLIRWPEVVPVYSALPLSVLLTGLYLVESRTARRVYAFGLASWGVLFVPILIAEVDLPSDLFATQKNTQLIHLSRYIPRSELTSRSGGGMNFLEGYLNRCLGPEDEVFVVGDKLSIPYVTQRRIFRSTNWHEGAISTSGAQKKALEALDKRRVPIFISEIVGSPTAGLHRQKQIQSRVDSEYHDWHIINEMPILSRTHFWIGFSKRHPLTGLDTATGMPCAAKGEEAAAGSIRGPAEAEVAVH